MTPLSTGIRTASRTPRTRGRPGRSFLAAGLVLGGLAVAGAPLTASAQADDSAVVADEAPPFEVLKLGCGVRQTDRAAAVRCRWSAPTNDAAAGLRLWRITVGADQGRQVVFRTDDVSVTTYTDAPVRPGHRSVYVIQAVNEAGRTVGLSRRAVVGVPPAPDVRPDIEPLRLHCRSGDDFRVGCTWTAPTVDGARTLTLWRSVDGGERERVLSSHHPFPTAYRDTVPDGTSRVAYVVIATDGDGQIVARSRAEYVTFRDAVPTDVAPTDVAPTDVAPAVAVTDVAPTTTATATATTTATTTTTTISTTVAPTTRPPRATDRVTGRVTDRATDRSAEDRRSAG